MCSMYPTIHPDQYISMFTIISWFQLITDLLICFIYFSLNVTKSETTSLLPFQNKCTQPEDVKLCTLILRPATAGPQRKKVVSSLTQCTDAATKMASFSSLSLHFPVFHIQTAAWLFFHLYNQVSTPLFASQCSLPYLLPSSLSVCQTLVKEAVVHPLEVEPGQFLPQTEQSLAPPPPPPPASQPSSHTGRARISLAISVGPAPVLPSTVTRSALMPRPPTLEDGMRGREGWRERSGGRERWGITKERVRGRLSQQKERKATQMLAIVLGEQREVIQTKCSSFDHVDILNKLLICLIPVCVHKAQLKSILFI